MLGDRIKKMRNYENITQQELAEKLMVSKSTIGMWENNKREPDIETIQRIAAVFDYPVTFLLNDTVMIGKGYSSGMEVEHCCPICGYNYVHLEDSIPIDFYQSPKSSGYALKFTCEAGHLFYMIIENYKGNNYMTYTDEKFRAINSVSVSTLTEASLVEKKISSLDYYGRKAVLELLDTEYARVINHLGSASSTAIIQLHRNKAAAGAGYDLSDEDEWQEIEVKEIPEIKKADFAVEVDGESMLPDFHDGDIVLIKLDSDVEVGKVGLFIHDGKGYIKERGKDRLISRNPDYPDIFGESRCIGLVIGTAELV